MESLPQRNGTTTCANLASSTFESLLALTLRMAELREFTFPFSTWSAPISPELVSRSHSGRREHPMRPTLATALHVARNLPFPMTSGLAKQRDMIIFNLLVPHIPLTTGRKRHSSQQSPPSVQVPLWPQAVTSLRQRGVQRVAQIPRSSTHPSLTLASTLAAGGMSPSCFRSMWTINSWACNNRAALDNFKWEVNVKFECSDSGPAGYFLGFNIHRDRAAKKLYISREHYFQALLERFNLQDCNPAKTPLPTGFRPVPSTDEEHAQARYLPFPQVVGSC
jgi:hypothetical protein